MMLPILISVSVAPGSYFFCASAVVATATATSPASSIDLAWLKTRWCIIVLPDVLAEAQAVFVGAALVSRRIECGLSMHDWGGVASDRTTAMFRRAEQAAAGSRFHKAADGSKECQMRRARNRHDAAASNEGSGP